MRQSADHPASVEHPPAVAPARNVAGRAKRADLTGLDQAAPKPARLERVVNKRRMPRSPGHFAGPFRRGIAPGESGLVMPCDMDLRSGDALPKIRIGIAQFSICGSDRKRDGGWWIPMMCL